VGSLERVRAALQVGRELSTLLWQFHQRRTVLGDDDEPERDEAGRPIQYYYIYQDLKPSNVIRTPGGMHFLIDFGTVREVVVQGGEHLFHFSSEGTHGYWAPETRENASSEMSDIYSLGASLYHVVSGQQPPLAGAQNAVRDLQQRLNPRYYGELLDVLDRCLEPDPAERRARIEQVGKPSDDGLPIGRLRRQFIYLHARF
jgi:serine/threonine protein kinase